MRLFLVRHGKAERRSATGADEDRELTERGRRQATRLGQHLAASERPPEAVHTSPAARAAQTAALIADALGVDPRTEDDLSLSTHPARVIELLGRLGGDDALVLVGHNPTLSIVTEALTRGPGGRTGLELRTGQAAEIDIADHANPVGAATLIDLLRFDD